MADIALPQRGELRQANYLQFATRYDMIRSSGRHVSCIRSHTSYRFRMVQAFSVPFYQHLRIPSMHGCEGSHRFLDPSVPWTPLESSPGQYLAAVGTCWKHLETIGTPCWFSIPKRYYSQLKKIRTSEGEWDSAFESNLTEYQVTRAKRISMESENL